MTSAGQVVTSSAFALASFGFDEAHSISHISGCCCCFCFWFCFLSYIRWRRSCCCCSCSCSCSCCCTANSKQQKQQQRQSTRSLLLGFNDYSFQLFPVVLSISLTIIVSVF